MDELGRVVEGPTEADPNPPANVRGTPRKNGVSRYQPNTKAKRMCRLGRGAAGLSLGVFLTTGPISAGIAGFVGGTEALMGTPTAGHTQRTLSGE